MTNLHDQTIALTMIVKNEAHIITRALESVADFVDYYCICDTGSTDNTIEVVENYLKENNLSGTVHQHEWKDFGHNRTLSLEACQGFCDYILQMDADEVYVEKRDDELTEEYPETILELLEADIVNIETFLGTLRYSRNLMFKDGCGVKWEGPCHEYIVSVDGSPKTQQTITSIANFARSEGGRSKNLRQKFLDDAKLFENYLEENPDHPRSLFYLGQCYDSAGEHASAIPHYLKAAELTSWSEEKCVAYLRSAECYKNISTHSSICDNVVLNYLNAYKANPKRLEPLHGLIQYYRLLKEYDLAAVYCDAALKIGKPDKSFLFVEDPVYKWKALDEISMIYYYVGRYKESYEVYLRLLDSPSLTEDQIVRIKSNMDYTRQVLRRRGEIY